MDEASAMLLDTGYRKPICHLSLSDIVNLRSTLLDYHCMLKVKASMDQFLEGLEDLKVLCFLQKYPEIIKPFFVDDNKIITSGSYYSRLAS